MAADRAQWLAVAAHSFDWRPEASNKICVSCCGWRTSRAQWAKPWVDRKNRATAASRASPQCGSEACLLYRVACHMVTTAGRVAAWGHSRLQCWVQGNKVIIWGLKFSWWWMLSLWFCGMWYCVSRYFTSILWLLTASAISVEEDESW